MHWLGHKKNVEIGWQRRQYEIEDISCLDRIEFYSMFVKEIFYAHHGCIYWKKIQ